MHVNVTAVPTALWTAQQLIESCPYDSNPRFLVRDRDKIYGREFQGCVKSLGIEDVKSAARSLWRSPEVERVIATIRHKCHDHIVPATRGPQPERTGQRA